VPQKTFEDVLARAKITESFKLLPRQAKVVFYAAVLAGTDGDAESSQPKKKFFTGDVLDQYEKVCKEWGLRILTTRRVGGIISELCNMGLIIPRVMSLGRHGWTRELEIIAPPVLIQDLVNDTKRELESWRSSRTNTIESEITA